MNNISADNYYLSPPYTDHAHFDNVIFVLYGLLHFILHLHFYLSRQIALT